MRRIFFLLASFLLLTSCAPPQTDSPPQPIPLTPFLTSTPAPLQTPGGLVAPLTPLPSPTPFAYTVQEGDTLSEIAERFRVSLDDLQAANPEINANAMSVGQVLKIPSNPDNPSGEPTPTPAPFTVEQIECYPTTDKGMWCFVLARNDFSEALENVSAQVTLVDSNGAAIATQTAFLALNILPPNSALPLYIFFPPDVPFDIQPQALILTAIRLLPDDVRYVPAAVNNALVEIDSKGYSARVNGLVLSQSQAATANQVWVAATVYDEAGRVVGVRRWESTASLPPSGSLPFDFFVSSVGGRISRVEFAVEARP
ncbi:MAG: LysM peptidoglycan-binding domain-containing protein [Anaerolineales bacterium]|nr:LysM peptidoglycan-binding domain-containing protein [Anaerolineales bacterium]